MDNITAVQDILQVKASYIQTLSLEFKTFGFGPTLNKGTIGRIGELQAAILTDHRIILDSSEKGIDIMNELGNTIGVKTTSSFGNTYIPINRNTAHLPNDTMILHYIDIDKFEILYYGPTDFLLKHCGNDNHNNTFTISRKKASSIYVKLLKQTLV